MKREKPKRAETAPRTGEGSSMAPKRIFGLLALCFCAFVVSASAQTLVNVNDTLYNADGTKASGRIVISWDPFTAVGGTTIDGGTLT